MLVEDATRNLLRRVMNRLGLTRVWFNTQRFQSVMVMQMVDYNSRNGIYEDSVEEGEAKLSIEDFVEIPEDEDQTTEDVVDGPEDE